VQCCTNSANTYTYRNGEFSDFDIKRDDFFQLMFCQRSDGTYEAEEIKKLPFYRFGKYAQELQDFIISKANELIQADHFFVTTLSNEQKMECVYRILNLNEELVRAIDNFDFTKNIPKIVIFLENETTITFESLILLCYFSIIGFDIIIFNPSGTCNPYSVVEKSIIFTHRLAEMNYQMTYSNVLTFKKSLFNFLGSKR
ncbi:MAG: YceG family protein, partial [Culicoidibacterales bacterium]